MSKADLAASSRDEMQAELRRQVAGVVWPGLTALGILLIFATEALHWSWRVHVLALILVFLSTLVWIVLQRWYLPAVWLLVLGSLAANSLTLVWLPSIPTSCLLALSSGLAALLIGPVAGLGLAAASSLVVLRAAAVLPAPASSASVPALIAIWGTIALVFVSSHFARQVTESLWASYLKMLQLLQQARDQRLELKQVQEDLVQANVELAQLSERLGKMYQVA